MTLDLSQIRTSQPSPPIRHLLRRHPRACPEDLITSRSPQRSWRQPRPSKPRLATADPRDEPEDDVGPEPDARANRHHQSAILLRRHPQACPEDLSTSRSPQRPRAQPRPSKPQLATADPRDEPEDDVGPEPDRPSQPSPPIHDLLRRHPRACPEDLNTSRSPQRSMAQPRPSKPRLATADPRDEPEDDVGPEPDPLQPTVTTKSTTFSVVILGPVPRIYARLTARNAQGHNHDRPNPGLRRQILGTSPGMTLDLSQIRSSQQSPPIRHLLRRHPRACPEDLSTSRSPQHSWVQP